MASAIVADAAEEVDFRTTDLVHILIGRGFHAERFSIKREIWKLASPTLVAISDHDLLSGQQTVLCGYDADSFNRYLNFLAQGKLILDNGLSQFYSFLDHYISAADVRDDRYKDIIIDAATNYFNANRASADGEETLPSALVLDCADSVDLLPLRNLYYDMWARRGTTAIINKLLEQDPWIRNGDFMKKFKERLRDALLRNRGDRTDYYGEEDKAVFKVGKPAASASIKRKRTP